MCQEISSMRIHYKDDEQTFVTMICDEDFKVERRCVEPVQNYDDTYRLNIRINNSLTPTLKSPPKKKSCLTTKDKLLTKTTSAKPHDLTHTYCRFQVTFQNAVPKFVLIIPNYFTKLLKYRTKILN